MFKNGPSKICGRQPLKYLKGCGLPKADHTSSNFLKGCLPQILLGPFLNTLFLNSFNFLLAFLFVYLWVLFRCFFLEDAHLSIWLILMNYFCGMVKRRKPLSLVSNWDHCQRSSPSQISDTMRLGLEPAQRLSSGFVEWSCAVVIPIWLWSLTISIDV